MARCIPWERGRPARLNTCGPAAHLRAGRPRSQGARSAAPPTAPTLASRPASRLNRSPPSCTPDREATQALITPIGTRVPRREDAALLTGRGRFIDDVDRAHQAHVWIVRSPHAHARIVSIDTADAAALPGVVAVLTHRDLAADGIAPLSEPNRVIGRDGAKTVNVDHPLLAGERAMHVGDPVAMVVARTRPGSAGRGRADRRRLRGARRGGRRPRRAGSGRAAALAVRSRQRGAGLGRRRRGRCGRGVRAGRPRHPARHRQQPRGHRPDGDPRSDRGVRAEGRPVHDPHAVAGRRLTCSRRSPGRSGWRNPACA